MNQEHLEELRQKLGHALGSGQILGIHPIEKETIERPDFEQILVLNGITPKQREVEGVVIAPATGADIV